MAADGELQQAQLQQLQHRVVSLLPSATEIVVQVGGSHLLCGRSHECDYPPEITHLPMLTSATNGHFTNSRDVHDSTTSSMVAGRGLYGIDGDQLVKIKPTVVVTQSLCSVCSIDLVTVERILRKAKLEPPPKIVNLNPFSIEDVLHDMLSVGSAIGLEAQSKAAVEKLQSRIQAASLMASKLAPAKHGKCAFLEWIDPLFCGGHWTPQLIAMAGGSHPLNPPSAPGQAAQPSGVISPEAVSAMDPDIVIISPCGLDLATAEEESIAALADQAWWRDLRAVREGRVVLVDGNAHFNRPGPRLVDALEFLVGLFNDMPECIPEGFPWKRLQMPEVRQQDVARAANANGASGAATSLTSAPKCGVTASDDKSPQKSATVDGNRNEAPAAVCGNGRGAAAALAPHLGPSCAPNLAHDVEEAHAAACGVGGRHYVDPVSGYMVFTEEALRARGYCCGRRCRHCPYGHLRIKPTPRTPRINRITRPTLLPWCDHPVPLSAYSTDVVLLVVLAGQSVSSVAASLDQLRQAGKGGDGDAHGGCSSCIGIPGQRHIVAVVAVDPSSRSCWRASPPTSTNATAVGDEPLTSNSACKSSSHSSPAASSHTASHEYADGLSSVMDCCAQLGLPIVAVPVHNQHQHGNPQADSAGVVLSTAECGHVLRQAAEVVTCAQRRHLEQHKDLMAEVGASCSSSQHPNPDLHDARPKDAATTRTDRALAEGQNCGARIPGGVRGPLAGLACVQQDGRETSGTSAWPELPWRASLDAQSKGRDGCVAPSPHELWSRVAAEMQLPYL